MLDHFDNFVFDRMKQKGFKMPRETEKPIRTFSKADLDVILESTKGWENEWDGQMMRGAMALYWGTMRRPSEIRTSRIQDLDLTNLSLHIEYPRGAVAGLDRPTS